MTVGLSGAGLSTVFYLLLAAYMPVRGLWRVARGRPPDPGEWRLIGRQAAIALGIVAVLAAMGAVLTLLIDGTSGTPAGPAGQPSSGVTGFVTSIAALGVVVAVGTLGALLAVIEVLAFLSRRGASPEDVTPPAGGRRGVDRVAQPDPVRTVPASPGSRPPRRSGAPSRAPVGSGRWTGTKN